MFRPEPIPTWYIPCMGPNRVRGRLYWIWEVCKAYVQTRTYPYLVHTLHGANTIGTNNSSGQ